ncbi:MAG TPA: neutral/alkaline non-lysosomal ceramidase N-terminal domain-containing protein [Actinomycetota bacterium]|nr:neutral/alkaline non-lysosomal ceramidase N-terminal domain-containing protein [Actinomycetota bacterium]
MRRVVVSLSVALAVCASMLGASASPPVVLQPAVKAGFARADLSWHVGAGQGQHGSQGNTVVSDRFDPYAHGAKQTPSDGLQSRIYSRAMVVEGTDGTRVAYVGHDLYLQQDMLHRRVAQLLEGTGITRETLMISASHNHSAPYLSTTSFGVWYFTDAFDPRHFEYASRQIAASVKSAIEGLRPVRMGASVVHLDGVQHNVLGPGVADDGSPRGFPRDHYDTELAVVRFDDITDPANPRPYGALVNFGMHPESLETYDMPSADFVGAVERYFTEQTGAQVVWSQGGLGDSEPDQSRANPPSAGKEYWYRSFSQMDRMSREIASRAEDAFNDVAADEHEVPAKHVAWRTDFPVRMIDRTFAGPASHPVPSFSNCRIEPLLSRGEVRGPGLPTCTNRSGPASPGGSTAPLKDAGVPVPDQYSPPSYGGVQESVRLHLQVLQLGEVVLASCPCEPVTDMTLNLKSRLDHTAGDRYDGFDWPCSPSEADVVCDFREAGWRAPAPRSISRASYDRMRAQIHNDARGWEELENLTTAESEPTDPAKIKGNFTHEEIQSRCATCEGFRLPLMSGTTNDYLGYMVTYREYQAGDHYRKALTAFGPHTADYVNTRLVRMAAELQGGPAVSDALLDTALRAEEPAIAARLAATTKAGEAETAAFHAAMPDDAGPPAIVLEPQERLERFSAAQVRWRGGNHFLGTPRVRVEREVSPGVWRWAATQDGGEIPTTLEWKRTSDPQSAARFATGSHESIWTATYEVFDRTQPGTYRFVLDGEHRSGRQTETYTMRSRPFRVDVWSGVTTPAVEVTEESISFGRTVSYPRTYTPVGVRYISPSVSTPHGVPYCFRCTFRGWALTGAIASATVTVDGVPVEATLTDGRWVVSGLEPASSATIEPGDLVDGYGNVNGERIVLR